MSAEVIPFYKPQKIKGKCSFCGVHEDRTDHMFNNQQEGKQARWVCGTCIRKCKSLITEPKKETV
jgi:ClpX C4-type zinc finger/Protein of unknown function (DUF1677)